MYLENLNEDSNNGIGDLAVNRQNLVGLLIARRDQLRGADDRRPPSNGHDTNGAEAPQRQSPHDVDAQLADAAGVSIGLVRQARRLVRVGNEALIVAAILQLLPIGTALRGAVPTKPNSRISRWNRMIALAGGGQ